MEKKHIQIKEDYVSTSQSKYGVYGYFKKHNDTCIYIGVDSNIDKDHRHRHHQAPSKRTEQRINRYLQSEAAEHVYYSVLAVCRDKEEMENIETMYILFFKALGQCEFNDAVSIGTNIANGLIDGITKLYRN